jgi:hypothetical protein
MEERPPAGNILKKQGGEMTKGGTPAWGLGMVLKTLTIKSKFVTTISVDSSAVGKPN